jgi:hypothetical protein
VQERHASEPAVEAEQRFIHLPAPKGHECAELMFAQGGSLYVDGTAAELADRYREFMDSDERVLPVQDAVIGDTVHYLTKDGGQLVFMIRVARIENPAPKAQHGTKLVVANGPIPDHPGFRRKR